jgi:hypothetical protein
MQPPEEFLKAIGFEEVKVEMSFPAFDCTTRNTRGYDFVLSMFFFGIRNFFSLTGKTNMDFFSKSAMFLARQ